MTDGVLDEAYERMHRTGPEFCGWLSNHVWSVASADDVGVVVCGDGLRAEGSPADR
jgi:hypothetical protein